MARMSPTRSTSTVSRPPVSATSPTSACAPWHSLFALNNLPVPVLPVRVKLLAPNGAEWVWGPAESSDCVRAPALDFCLLVIQLRHRNDVAVTARGKTAQQWLTIAQAFACPPGPGRSPVKRDPADRRNTR